MRETSTTERVGLAVALLHSGGAWPTRTLAARLALTPGGTWMMMSRLARVLPIVLDADGWRLTSQNET